jgi:hypothetical protein
MPLALVISLPLVLAAAPEPDYLALVRRCCDVLIEKGRDRYGPVQSPLFMSILNVERQSAEAEPAPLDGWVRTEGRMHRRNPGGADLWEDQSLIRVLRIVSQLTGDPRYSEAADEYIGYFLEHCRKPTTGLLTWGSHLYWDAFRDAAGGDQEGAGPHEILVREPFWDMMGAVAPERVEQQIEGMWRWHVVDKETGLFNRHDDASPGCDFAFLGSELVYAFAFLHHNSGAPVWQERAHLIANWHWDARNKDTGLAPDAPGLRDRYDGTHCFTTLPGPHASLLLRAFALTGDEFYRDVALGHLRAYDRYGWDAAAESYWGMLRLDGTPVPEEAAEAQRPRRMDVYDDFRPTGHVDVWQTTMYSYEFPVVAAQSYAYAAQLTGERDMLTATERWAKVIRANLPPTTGRRWAHLLREALPDLDQAGGTYAENYGRAIDFLLRAAVVLNDPSYAQTARAIAADAIARLHHPDSGLFMGHAAKRTYEATDGVGYLLYALLELNAYPELLEPNL